MSTSIYDLDYAVEDELARLSTMELAPLSPPVHGGKIVTPISEMELAVMEIQAATARDLMGRGAVHGALVKTFVSFGG